MFAGSADGAVFGVALWARKLVGELVLQKFQVRLPLPMVGGF